MFNEDGAERLYQFNEELRPFWSLFQPEYSFRYNRVVQGFCRLFYGDNRDARVAEHAIGIPRTHLPDTATEPPFESLQVVIWNDNHPKPQIKE